MTENGKVEALKKNTEKRLELVGKGRRRREKKRGNKFKLQYFFYLNKLSSYLRSDQLVDNPQ